MRTLNIFRIFCAFAAFTLFALLISGCERAKNSADLESIDAFVSAFHKNVTDMSFGKIYDETTIEFKRKTERDDFITGMNKVASILEVPTETRFIGTADMKSDSGENLIASQYITTYTHGSATETFIFRSLEAQLQLFQYNIKCDGLHRELERIVRPAPHAAPALVEERTYSALGQLAQRDWAQTVARRLGAPDFSPLGEGI